MNFSEKMKTWRDLINVRLEQVLEQELRAHLVVAVEDDDHHDPAVRVLNLLAELVHLRLTELVDIAEPLIEDVCQGIRHRR